MVTLKALLGARSEVHFECMYTKHKTQKRKTWHDGFLSLSASHKLVLFEEMPPDGRVLDEAKMNQFDWERRDEEYISVPKFLVEIINETPLDIGGAGASAPKFAGKAEPAAAAAPPSREQQAPRVVGAKFKAPVAGDSAPPRPAPRPGGARQPLGRYAQPPQQPQVQQPPPPPRSAFDFDRNPTSEWSYAPNAVERSAADVAALFEGRR